MKLHRDKPWRVRQGYHNPQTLASTAGMHGYDIHDQSKDSDEAAGFPASYTLTRPNVDGAMHSILLPHSGGAVHTHADHAEGSPSCDGGVCKHTQTFRTREELDVYLRALHRNANKNTDRAEALISDRLNTTAIAEARKALKSYGYRCESKSEHPRSPDIRVYTYEDQEGSAIKVYYNTDRNNFSWTNETTYDVGDELSSLRQHLSELHGRD